MKNIKHSNLWMVVLVMLCFQSMIMNLSHAQNGGGGIGGGLANYSASVDEKWLVSFKDIFFNAEVEASLAVSLSSDYQTSFNTYQAALKNVLRRIEILVYPATPANDPAMIKTLYAQSLTYRTISRYLTYLEVLQPKNDDEFRRAYLFSSQLMIWAKSLNLEMFTDLNQRILLQQTYSIQKVWRAIEQLRFQYVFYYSSSEIDQVRTITKLQLLKILNLMIKDLIEEFSPDLTDPNLKKWNDRVSVLKTLQSNLQSFIDENTAGLYKSDSGVALSMTLIQLNSLNFNE